MFRSLLVALAMVLVLPTFAKSWYVNAKTSPSTGQGTIAPAGNTFIAGTTGTSHTCSVDPSPGYTVSRVTLDGINISPSEVGGEGESAVYRYTVPYSGKSWRYVVAYFVAAPTGLSISTSAGTNGTIQEVNRLSLTGIPEGESRTLLVAPAHGYQVATLTASNALPVENPDGTRTVVYSNLQANQSVAATFSLAPVTANAGPDLFAAGNGLAYAVTLDGSRSLSTQGALTYAWSGPPELVFEPDDDAVTTVYSNTAGTFTATLTVSANGVSDTDAAQVTVPTRAAYLEGLCTPCHITRNPKVVADYDISKHKQTGGTQPVVACQTCHDPENSTHYTVHRPTGICQPCHATVPGSTHATPDLAAQCLDCHNSHSTRVVATNLASHVGGAFGGPKAQYVAQGAVCADCHAGGSISANAEILDQFAASGHADTSSPAWIATQENDWPIANPCRRCHTAAGFLDALTGSSTIGQAQEPGQILSCKGCHTADFAVRTAGPYQSPYPLMSDTETVPYAPHPYSDFADSNLCVPCHAGMISGESIKQVFAAGSPPTAPLLNHDLVAAGILDNTIGYEFGEVSGGIPDAYWKAGTWHAGIGKPSLLVDTGTRGACITCHMSAPVQGHSFRAVANDANGIITNVLAQAVVCDKCHPSQDPVSGGGDLMTAQVIQSHKQGYLAALQALAAQLRANNLDPDLPAPTDWGTSATIKANNMGAYYNYFLLSQHDRGGYVHNPTYVKRLIQYSIDWLDDGSLNNSVYSAVQALTLPAQVAGDALEYLGIVGPDPENCCACHVNFCF